MANVLVRQPHWKRDLLPCLPPYARELLEAVCEQAPLEEIRLRAGKPLELRFSDGERLLRGRGGGGVASRADCERALAAFAGQSLYAYERELSEGFLTLAGGYRVAVCGRVTLDRDGLMRFDTVGSLCVRIPRQALGAASRLLARILDPDGKPRPTLIVSPPACGKTTLLRDAARALSNGLYGAKPCRVGLVDERYEFAGSPDETAMLDVGERTDVLFGAPRAQGVRLMVRTLSPDVIVTDEIGSLADAEAVQDAVRCGVKVLASAHAASRKSAEARRSLHTLIAQRAFEIIVLLGRSAGVGSIEGVWDLENERAEGGENHAASGVCNPGVGAVRVGRFIGRAQAAPQATRAQALL